jgi:hypothetical protein
MPNMKFKSSDPNFPAGTDSRGHPLCRCCGKPVLSFDGHPIHTKCIPKHWGKHANGVNASRCVEFGQKSSITKRRARIDSQRKPKKTVTRIKLSKGGRMMGPFGAEYSGRMGY